MRWLPDLHRDVRTLNAGAGSLRRKLQALVRGFAYPPRGVILLLLSSTRV